MASHFLDGAVDGTSPKKLHYAFIFELYLLVKSCNCLVGIPSLGNTYLIFVSLSRSYLKLAVNFFSHVFCPSGLSVFHILHRS